MTADPLVEVAARVYADFAEHATVAGVLAVIARTSTRPAPQRLRNWWNDWPANAR